MTKFPPGLNPRQQKAPGCKTATDALKLAFITIKSAAALI